MMDADAIYRRLRRLARDSGFDVRRVDEGYQLLRDGRVIAGDRRPLDLRYLAIELQKRHVLGH
ncbi:hypothetical protein [Mesorhizobium sp. B2-7-2]|uniref:hypothetical protein n=1 Tax=Mesorhizobium sp. B2-7-2 TaxID=2589908 RepID=UPI001125CC34|nr:hypothetical protein [Mesorhizobium sp. B2-7-2]TPJ28028.1 hypothetical protein FJ425_13380 [Mesorhizobium sp. B2-7-2]